MARPVSRKADIEAMQLLAVSLDNIVDYRPIVAYTMWACGCTYKEIGDTFAISPSLAEYHVKELKKALAK
jgi:hypothetical protein